jgi:hypothetical protein
MRLWRCSFHSCAAFSSLRCYLSARQVKPRLRSNPAVIQIVHRQQAEPQDVDAVKNLTTPFRETVPARKAVRCARRLVYAHSSEGDRDGDQSCDFRHLVAVYNNVFKTLETLEWILNFLSAFCLLSVCFEFEEPEGLGLQEQTRANEIQCTPKDYILVHCEQSAHHRHQQLPCDRKEFS